MNHIHIENKAGRIKLNDIVMQPVMDELISEIGRIFGATAADEGRFTGELTNCAENAVDTLEIVIHSPGGSVLDGYTLYNEILALRERGVQVTATINSLAASMASVIAMAADHIRMVPTGRMMIHEVQQAVRGDAETLTSAARTVDEMSNEIAAIYAGRTGSTVSEMRALMKKETWMNAAQALEAGFIDAVFDIRPSSGTKASMNLLKRLFPSNESEIAELEASLAEADSLRNDLGMLTDEVATLKADITAKDQTIAEHLSAIATRDEQIAALTSQVEDGQTALAEAALALTAKDEEIQAAHASAGQQATEALAAIGQDAPLPAGEDAGSATPHLDAFNQLKGAEATAYFKQHRKEINAENRLLSKRNS